MCPHAGSHQNGGLWRDGDGRRNSLSQNIEESFGVKPSDLPGAVALETVPGDVSDRNCPWPRPLLGLFSSSSRSLPVVAAVVANLLLSPTCA